MDRACLTWLVWAWSRSVQIPVYLTLSRVGAQGIPKQVGLLTVVVTSPVFHNPFFTAQHLAAQHTVKCCTCWKDTEFSSAIWRCHGSTVPPFTTTVVGHDVSLKLGEGEKLFVAAAALNQVAFLTEVTPVMGSVLHQLFLGPSASLYYLAIMWSNLNFLFMHIKQMHLHVSKGRSYHLTAATFNLQLHWVFTILLIKWLWRVRPVEGKEKLITKPSFI